MEDLEMIESDLKELLFLSKFIINKDEYTKERKNIKKMIHSIESGKYYNLIKRSEMCRNDV